MTDATDSQLLEEIGLVFPQYGKDFIESIIANQKDLLQRQQQPVTFANLLPLCIDFLLGVNQAEVNRTSDESSHSTSSSSSSSTTTGSSGSNKRMDNVHMIFDFHEQSYREKLTSSSESESSPDVGVREVDDDVVIIDFPKINDHHLNMESIPSTIQDPVINKSAEKSHMKRANKYSKKHQVARPKKMIEPQLSQEKHIDNYFEDALKQVLVVVPDVEPNFALNALMRMPPCDVVTMANCVVESLLEASYPKKMMKPDIISTNQKESEKINESTVNYFNIRKPVSSLYVYQCLVLLQNKFRKSEECQKKKVISTRTLKSALRSNNFRFAPTVNYLQEKLLEMASNVPTTDGPSTSKKSQFYITFIKNRRSFLNVPSVLDHDLEKEVKFIELKEREKSEAEDYTLAHNLNAQQYVEESQTIECGCCFGEAAFEDMVQCTEGHLFCKECLKNYAQEAIFGGGKTQLSCMTNECSSGFLLSQLRKSLSEVAIEKYLERLQDESLKMVELPNLVKCPFCDYAAEIPENDKVFRCQNEKCRKETCRYCKEEWKDHFGLPCNEVENKHQKNFRVS